MKASKEDKSPFGFSEDGPPALSDIVGNAYEEKRKDHTNVIHGPTIYTAISLMNCDRPRNQDAYRSKDKKRGFVYPDVVSEGGHCTARDTINPHPNRHDGEKCRQL